MASNFTYDELPLWSAPFGLMLLDTIRLKPGMQVLDIGSGSGFPMLEVAERLGSPGKVTGIDPSEDSISMIREKIRLKVIRNAEIIQGAAENLPFENDWFDLIISNNGLNNVEDQQRSFRECFRVGKPGSQMVITMNLPHTMIEFYDRFAETLQEFELPEEITRMHNHISAKRKPVEYMKELIQHNGFTIRTIQIDGFKYRFTSGTAFFRHYLIRNYFLGSWKEIVPGNLVQDVFAALENKLNEEALKKGELTMSIPYVSFDCRKNIRN
ncbi:MAG: methyltransferase domain-containing protein [bacterium]